MHLSSQNCLIRQHDARLQSQIFGELNLYAYDISTCRVIHQKSETFVRSGETPV